MIRINLLPHREEKRRRRQQQFFGIAVFSIILGLVAAGAVWFFLDQQVEQQAANVAYMKGEISKLDKQIEEILGLENQKRKLLARMEIIETLQRSRPEIVHVFDEVVRVLPEGVYLTYLKQTGTRFEIRGVAQSSTRVSAFMRNIDGSEWLADPSLQIVQRAGGGGSEFTLFANQRAKVPPEEAAQGQTVAAK